MASNGTTADAVEVVYIDAAHVRMSATAMRMLTKATGRTMEQLMQSEESADKFQTMAFFELRRRHPGLDAAELWQLAGDAEVEMSGEPPDPFGTASSTGSPALPATGESTPTPSTT